MTISVKQILGIGLLLFSITAYTSEGYHHSDEHWQLLEFANFKLGRYPQQNLVSEYSKEMRSAFQPGIAYVSIRSLEAVGINNPFHIAFALRLVSCMLGWLVLAIIVINCKKLGVAEKHQKLLAIVSMFLWFIPYSICRFSNENWSGIFFCFGLLAIALNSSNSFKYYFLSGILVGISYLCRFQIAFALIGLAAWLLFIQRAAFLKLLSFTIAFTVMLVVGALVDHWFYGHYTFTAYNYFYANIIEGVAASFGVSPWHQYFIMIFESAAAPISIVILLGYIYSFYKSPKHLFHWVVASFLFCHCLVGHKELRFLFPLIYLLPFILVSAVRSINLWTQTTIMKFFRGVIIVENVALLIAIVFFKPAEETITFDRFVYNQAQKRPVVIFYKEHDPYQFGDQRQYFYAPNNLTLIKLENDSTIKDYRKSKDELLLIFDDRFDVSDNVKPYIGKQVFNTFPSWLKNFNVGNWLSRAKVWALYESNKSKP